MPTAFCKTCNENCEVEDGDEPGMVFCTVCGEEFPLADASSSGTTDTKYANYKVGRIMKVENVAKSKELKICQVDVCGDGDESKYLPVVTNAKYAEAGWLVVVACIGAIVPAGATWSGEDDDSAVKVAKRNISGVESRGMLCDCPMLGWTGGAKGFIQQLPDTYAVGSAPPDTRPRL